MVRSPVACSILVLAIAGMICVTGSACYGPNVSTFPPAVRPEGIPAWLHVADDSLRVEILSADGDELFVLMDAPASHSLAGRLVRVPFVAVRRGEFEYAGPVPSRLAETVGVALALPLIAVFAFLADDDSGDWLFATSKGAENPETYAGSGNGIAADSVFLDRLRLLSRYPQGVDDQLLARLEAIHGETIELNPGGDL